MNTKRRPGLTVLLTLIAAALAAVDQWCKILAQRDLKGQGPKKAVSWLFELRYAENTGAAFSMLENHTWIFMVLAGLVTVLLVMVLYRFSIKPDKQHRFTILLVRLVSILVMAGGLGNLIDRSVRGYVIDYINLTFMDFPIFNLADTFITVGVAILLLYLIFKRHAFEEMESVFEGKEKDSHDPA